MGEGRGGGSWEGKDQGVKGRGGAVSYAMWLKLATAEETNSTEQEIKRTRGGTARQEAATSPELGRILGLGGSNVWSLRDTGG